MLEHVVFTESSRNVGGQELQLMQQMAAMQAHGIACTLVCPPGGKVDAAARARGLAVVNAAFRNSLHLPSILILVALLRRTRAGMVICHSGHDANNAALAARLVRPRPFVLRSRTYLAGRVKPLPYNVLADATMVPSHYLRNALLDNPAIHAERIHVVYPGIDFAGIDQRSSEPLPSYVADWLAAGSGPLLLHVAMLRGEKGHLLMLEVLAQLRQRWPQLRYLIAGEGDARAAIEARIAALGLQQQVLLAGSVMPASCLFRHANLLVMPSTYEPLGMSQIEALALGVPVVVSATGGIPETVSAGRTGVLVPPGDVAAWAAAIEQALSAPQAMCELAQQGAQDVRARFSVEHNLQQILALQADFARRQAR